MDEREQELEQKLIELKRYEENQLQVSYFFKLVDFL